MFLNANILHRYITPWSILVNPSGAEGDQGVLINLQHAALTPLQGGDYDDEAKAIATQQFQDYLDRVSSHTLV